MWPWEHLALGYLTYAGARRLRSGSAPTGAAALTVALASQLPDIVDKPLAWTFSLLPSGTSLAHSVLVAAAASGVVAGLAARRGRPDVAVAFAVGYGTHLLGDVTYPLLVGGAPATGAVLWPFVVTESAHDGFLVEFQSLLAAFGAFLGTPRGRYYLVGEALLVGGALARWVADGAPGLDQLRRALGR